MIVILSTRSKIASLVVDINFLKDRIRNLEASANVQYEVNRESSQCASPEDANPLSVSEPADPVEPIPSPPQKKRVGFEQQFGVYLPVWIGGIALALAGFYFVKYSIDAGWLSPYVRILLGIIAGISMIGVGQIICNKPNFANGTRIAQTLSGAGLVDLYVCIFAAANLYHLIPPLVSFAGMGAVTAAAVVRNGPRILDSFLSDFCRVYHAASRHKVSLQYI